MRAWNFCAGPAAIPEEVLKEVQEELLEWNDAKSSVMEVSHRSDFFQEVASESKKDFIENTIELFKDNDEFSCLEDKGIDISIYEDEDDFLSKLDWDKVLNAMKKYADKEYLENKISNL